jgi:hypothetical protein
MSGAHADLRAQISGVVEAGAQLWRAGSARRAAWLAAAFSALNGGDRALHEELLRDLPGSTGLSREMVRWALASTLDTCSESALQALHASAPLPGPRARLAQPARLCVVILAGNVFTAAARAVLAPLLFGVPVVAKAAADDVAFVCALQAALARADQTLARAFRPFALSSDDELATQLLLEQADIVSVFGGDNTLNTIRAQLSATVSFVGHGHGLGAAFVDRGALASEVSAREAARRLARDIAAYDQRGCLSPLVAWVRAGEPIDGETFAHFTFEALGELAESLARGPLPRESAAAQLSFRGIAALRGRVFEGDGFAVCYEGKAPLRISPGYRNLQVLDVSGERELCEKLAPLGVHLKCLGVAGVADVGALAERLPARVAPRVCALGSMQTPKLDALQDGVPVWEGLLRYVEIDAREHDDQPTGGT